MAGNVKMIFFLKICIHYCFTTISQHNPLFRSKVQYLTVQNIQHEEQNLRFGSISEGIKQKIKAIQINVSILQIQFKHSG